MIQALRKEYRGKDEVYAAAKGMLKGLGDPFTRFLTPQVCDRKPRLIARRSSARACSALPGNGWSRVFCLRANPCGFCSFRVIAVSP